MTIREFTVDLTPDEATAAGALADHYRGAELHPAPTPGRKTFAFDEDALIAVCDGDFERFLWTAFDRVEERGGMITLSKGDCFVFYLPVDKLQDPEIRRAVWDFVSGRLGLQS